MTQVALALLIATGVVTACDWAAVVTSRRRLEYVLKPAVMLGLIAFAVAIRPASTTERTFFVFALALGLASDVFLMLPRDMFLAGLVAALAEHIAYVAGFRARGLSVAALLVVAIVFTFFSVAAFLPPIIRALRRRHPRLVWPVVAYIAVFVVMVLSAGGTGSPVALLGALLFFYSDALLAWNRFVKPLPYGRIVNMVPYHLGEAFLVVSLLS